MPHGTAAPVTALPSPSRRRTDQRLIVVADTGPGIAPEDLPRVFDRMWRGRTGQAVAGSGIGLAIVRELVMAHGGTVDVASDGRSGTTFTVRLPLVD